ncbi:MAG: T9SS type A sorting domain-containing protein [Bacteroidota bacterium]|nr:T9SS type A sorting domain-containing protein [Bacteroidota bacterium]MDX5428439.1 T9SS type A sorting domain-containing protein [Bacteroidota bacterium]MDX5448207.1 T9SS type A sorting domain-containing protein [Bacteroidota bacterium]MDX5506203.1 T9SS type A sorting domain-containing protein [Bacteroidota bacterium]
MKSWITTFLALISLVAVAQQPCTPDPNLTEPGIYPPGGTTADSLVIMPDAPVWSPYDETAQLVVPSDTTIDTMGIVIPATIDSIRIVRLDGLPAGLNYLCDNPRCKWNGGENGCVNIFGTTSPQPTGNYFVTVKTYGYVDLGFLGVGADTVEFYMRIRVVGPIGIEEENSTISSALIFPQPADDLAMISIRSEVQGRLKYNIVDLSGAILMQGERTLEMGEQEIPVQVNELASGSYFIQLDLNGKTTTRRLMVQH